MIRVLFAAPERDWTEFEAPLRHAFEEAGLQVDLSRDHPSETVEYVIYAPTGGLADFAPFTNLKAVQSLWAGVDRIVGNDTITVPLCRMVEPGLEEGMTEWVVGQVLRHHLGFDRYIGQTDGEWKPVWPPLARNRSVGILGLGELGQASARALAGLNFRVRGWSRSGKALDGVETHAGDEGFVRVLETSEILVLLLPATPATENILDADAIARLPGGAVIVNPGRGTLIDDDALLEALDTGAVSHATLDVFREEPLPAEHPFWSDPHVTVTPHVASDTRAETAARVVAENIRRGAEGEPFLHVVDRERGY